MTGSKSDYGWNQAMNVSAAEKIRQDLKTAMRNKDAMVRDALRQVMSEYPSLTVPVQVKLEDGRTKDTTRPKRAEEITDETTEAKKWRGLTVAAITDENVKKYRVEKQEGVLILKVDIDSTAYEAGLRAGFVIKEIDKSINI